MRLETRRLSETTEGQVVREEKGSWALFWDSSMAQRAWPEVG